VPLHTNTHTNTRVYVNVCVFLVVNFIYQRSVVRHTIDATCE